MSVEKNLVLSYDGIDVSEEDLTRLEPTTYINDNIINFYLKYMRLCSLKDQQRQKVHIFDSFFCAVLDQMDEQRVKRWLRHVNIFEKEALIIPMVIEKHWLLVVVKSPCAIMNDNSARPSIYILNSSPRHEEEKTNKLINQIYNFLVIASSMKGRTIYDYNLRQFMPIHQIDVPIQVIKKNNKRYLKCLLIVFQ